MPKQQDEIRLDGHAFEARLYAEDAAKGFLPATGTLHHLMFPDSAAARTEIRVETGVRAGDMISPYYDPMIAKLVVHGADRPSALAALSDALEATEVAGSVTNLAFLARLARDADFSSGDVDTGLISRKQEALTSLVMPSREIVATALLEASGLGHETRIPPPQPLPTKGRGTHAAPAAPAIAIGVCFDRSFSESAVVPLPLVGRG